MFLVLGRKIAESIKRANPDETASIEVMSYALTNIIHSGTIIAGSLLISLPLGIFMETLVALFWFMWLRVLTGGFHYKSLHTCAIFSVTAVLLCPYIARVPFLLLWIDYTSAALLLVFSPAQNKSKVPNGWLKVFSLLAIALNMIVFKSNSASVAIFFVSLLTVRKGVKRK